MSALPWPKADEFGYAFDELSAKDAALRFQRQRAEAAMSRLQIALATLKDIRDHAHTLEDAKGYADEALLDMGDIP
jgi:hypothetical protein